MHWGRVSVFMDWKIIEWVFKSSTKTILIGIQGNKGVEYEIFKDEIREWRIEFKQ